MTGGDIAPLVSALASVGAVIVSVLTYLRAAQIEKNTNHITDQLVARTATVAHAEGVAEGEAESGKEGA